MQEDSPFPFHPISTDRLYLRRVIDSDLPRLLAIRSDPRVMKYIDRPKENTIKEVKKVLDFIDQVMKEQTGINWGITLKGDPTLIGTIGIWKYEAENNRAEIGYLLDTNYHRQGLMQEAMVPVLEYAQHTTQLHTLVANVNPANRPSRRLLKRNGFFQEGLQRECFFFEGRYHDNAIYGKVFE